MSKKLTEMSREELLEVIQHLALVVSRKAGRDLQPNRAANERHQKMKRTWGARKARLVDLLAQCLPFLGEQELRRAIQDELSHEERNFQRRVRKTWVKTEARAGRKTLICPECRAENDGGPHRRPCGKACDMVFGRRGWRQLGVYDG